MPYRALFTVLLSLVFAALWHDCAAAQPPTAERPNVVLIMTDDVGYGDIGCYGAPDIETPHIDRLAEQGVRMTDFYAAPQCTPTRAALMTGRYQQRVGLGRALPAGGEALEMGLAPDDRTLPQLLANNGYRTGLVGKWHLGFKPEFGPNAHGFDYFFGFLSGYIDYYTHVRIDGQPDLYENERPVKVDGYMTDLITERSLKFIEQSAGRPFFLEVSYNATHWPYQVPDEYSESAGNASFQSPTDRDPAKRSDYVKMMEQVDDGVGQIVARLEALGLTQNTLVIFTNDNGGEWLSRNLPLFHRKDSLWEGGIRVPTIFRWPGRIPPGQTSPQVGITMDLTATILAATGTAPPREPALDGIDLLPILEGRQEPIERTLFWRIAVSVRRQYAVRRGDWKMMLDGDDLMLFNVRDDISERNDLARLRPDLIGELIPLIANWQSEVDLEAIRRSSGRPGIPRLP